jgi:uncharacterized membrane protein YraQ (UPF0718 family)
MPKVVRRVGVALGAFAVAWLAISLAARWLFGSGNTLVWVLAAVAGAVVYVAVLRRDQRGG